MNRRILLVFLSLILLVITAGCSDGLKGMWAVADKSTWDGSNVIRLLYVDVADNGDYLIRDGNRYYHHESPGMNVFRASSGLTSSDEVLNKDEAFAVSGSGIFGSYHWNGIEVKIAERYKWSGTDGKSTMKVPKKDLTTKDGKLLFFGKTYKKIDNKELEKMKEEWKKSLKTRIGRKESRYIYSCGDVQARIAKIIIVENGKEEVFEEGKANSVKQEVKQDNTKQLQTINKSEGNKVGSAYNRDFSVPDDEKAPWKETKTEMNTGEKGKAGVITGTEVRMRAGASLNDSILGYFDKGERVTILERGNGWYKVRCANGREGWVSADFCK